MKTYLSKGMLAIFVSILLMTSCKKEQSKDSQLQQPTEETILAEAQQLVTEKQAAVANFQKEYGIIMEESVAARTNKNVLQVLQHPSIFKTFLAAVAKADLTSTLSASTLDATVFAPTDFAFAKLPAPFNNAVNIAGITDPDSIYALRNMILYHLLGTEKLRHEFVLGRSSDITLKPEEGQNDNLVYSSNSFGLLVMNGKSLVLCSNLKASNAVIHVVDDVLLPPAETIAQVLMTYPEYSSLFAALIQTGLFGTFTGPGNFTLFAPTNTAFAKLPAPFNNQANIETITDSVQLATLMNILQYHISESRYFAWDLGHYKAITTMASVPSNNVTGIMGLNKGWVKGNKNVFFAKISPANIFTCNGVMHVIDQVLKQ